MHDDGGCLVLVIIVAAFLFGCLVGNTNDDDVRREHRARGYCEAIAAEVVADSLCIRGDSIVARLSPKPAR